MSMASNSISVKASDALKQCYLNVEVTGVRRLAFRLWLASKVFAAGAWIAGLPLKWNISNSDDIE